MYDKATAKLQFPGKAITLCAEVISKQIRRHEAATTLET